jgi:hypothetical protein
VIFTLTERAFEAALADAQCSLAMAGLCSAAVEEPHVVQPELGVDPGDTVAQSRCAQWIARRPRAEGLFLVTALREGTERVTRLATGSVRVEVVPGTSEPARDPPRLSIKDACRVASMPLSVWVEDSRSDGSFLRRIADRRRARIERLERQGALRFAHGGGATIARQIESLEPLEALRSWVMVDSDRESGLAALPKKVRDLVDVCRTRGVPLVVLTRREIENYLPLEAVEWWRANDEDFSQPYRDWVTAGFSAVVASGDPERWYVDMKVAFGSRCARMFVESAVGWRWSWFVNDRSATEFEGIVASLERRRSWRRPTPKSSDRIFVSKRSSTTFSRTSSEMAEMELVLSESLSHRFRAPVASICAAAATRRSRSGWFFARRSMVLRRRPMLWLGYLVRKVPMRFRRCRRRMRRSSPMGACCSIRGISMRFVRS